MNISLGRSARLTKFIDSLGIDRDSEIYSINHPTEQKDRRDFKHGNFRIITEVENEYLSYKFHHERFVNTSLNGLAITSFMKINDISTFNADLNLFQKEVNKLYTLSIRQRIQRTIRGLKITIAKSI